MMNKTDITITSTRDIHMLKAAWERLDHIAAEKVEKGEIDYIDYSFYQTYEWNQFVYNTYSHRLVHTEYVVASSDGEAKMILPLMVDSINKRLRIINGRISGICNVACPYQGAEAKALMEALFDHLQDLYPKEWKYKFRDVPSHSPLVSTGFERGARGNEKCSFHVPVCQFGSYEEYLSSLGKNIYKNIRKAYNHLTTDGKTMCLTCYTSVTPPSRHLLSELWRLYFRRQLTWDKKHNTFLRKLACRAKTLHQVLLGKQTKSMLLLKESELYVLTIDGKAAAFMHTYVHNGHILMPKLAIDASFARYSPGILLIQEAMKLFIPRGIKDFDMCRGEERYKTEVGGVNQSITSLTLGGKRLV